MKLNTAVANLPSTTSVGGRPPRRRSPRSRAETSIALDAREIKERKEEVKMYTTCKKLEEKMDDLLSKAKLPDDAECIDEQVIIDRATKYMNQTKDRVNKMYERYQEMWKGYCIENLITTDKECEDKYLLAFFKEKEDKYAPSTLWVIYSCINAYFIDKFGKNLREYPRLTRYLKRQTHTYVTKKSKVFTPHQMEEGINKCMEANDPKLTQLGVTVSILYAVLTL